MSETDHPVDHMDENAAELAAMTAAIAESDADPCIISHDEMCAWLLELAAGNFETPPPLAE